MSDTNKQTSAKYFDTISSDYDNNRIPEPIRCYPLLWEKVSKNAKSIVDIGCGTGSMLQMIEQNTDDEVKLVGVDLSEGMISEASKKANDRMTFMVGDVENLPFEDNSFDAVLCMHSFHHYPNPEKAMSELFRICTEGGAVYIVENYKKGIARYIANLVIILWYRRRKGDMKVYSIGEVETFMKAANAKNVTSELLTEKSLLVQGIK